MVRRVNLRIRGGVNRCQKLKRKMLLERLRLQVMILTWYPRWNDLLVIVFLTLRLLLLGGVLVWYHVLMMLLLKEAFLSLEKLYMRRLI